MRLAHFYLELGIDAAIGLNPALEAAVDAVHAVARVELALVAADDDPRANQSRLWGSGGPAAERPHHLKPERVAEHV